MTSEFPTTKVYITENNPDGKATFLDILKAPTESSDSSEQFSYVYSTSPILCMDDYADINHHIAVTSRNPFPFFPEQGGTACAILDVAPNPDGLSSEMYRTKTLDYVVILKGILELELLGGEKRILKEGEIVVQRECFHRWRNTSTNKGARMLIVSVGSQGAVLGQHPEFPTKAQSLNANVSSTEIINLD